MRRLLHVALVAASVAACTGTGDGATPAPAAAPSGVADASAGRSRLGSARAPRPRRPVVVYLLRKGADAYNVDAYDPLLRPGRGARRAGTRLQVALAELVQGPTREERRGYTSAFSRSTADVLRRVELRGGRAVVDFHDFRRDHPEWSTSSGGSAFLMQLSRTVFQFGRIESALFRIDRSCRLFWEFLQAGGCEVVHRDGRRTPEA